MADSYFAGFDLIIRDTDGVEIPLANYTLTIAFEAIEIEVESDENGFVNAELLEDIPPESPIEIFDDTDFYEGVLNQVTKADALDAAIENKINRFIIEDNYPTASETVLVDIYVQDTTVEGTTPEYAGTVRPGETLFYPYESAKGKSLRIYKVERDEEESRRITDLALADYVDFDPASTEVETGLVIDETEVIGGTNGYFLFNNAGVVGNVFLGFVAEIIAASFELNLNSGSEQIAYTVPAGLEFILTKRAYRNPSDDLTGESDTISLLDRDGNPADVLTLSTSGLDATNKREVKLIETAMQIYTAGDTVNFLMSSGIGAGRALQVDIFGYFRAIPLDILDGGETGTSFGGESTDGGDAGETFTDGIDGGGA